jgi:hypothetical protein
MRRPHHSAGRRVAAAIAVTVLFAATALAQERPPAVKKGAVQGRVLREDTGEPLIEARVQVVGTPLRALTDIDGRFRLELPPGTYELRVFYDVYQPLRVRRVVVRAGEVNTLNVVLRRAPDEVIRVVIDVEPDRSTAAALLVERKKSATASDAVSAEQIAKSPDANASDAVKRVVGATVVDGKYVYIRGLGERYSNTLLNGAFLPSSEPDRPAVPLDIFPSVLLSNLTLNKTALPDIPGDFAGGSLNINTREFPEKLTFKVDLKGSVNTATSFREMNGYPGGKDYFGFDDGTRALPAEVPRDRGVRLGVGDPPLTRDEMVRIATSFRDIWQVRRLRTGMDHGIAATVGGTEGFRDNKLGYLASVSFSKSYRTLSSEIIALRASGSELVPREKLNDEEGRESTQLGGLLDLGFTLGPRHKLHFVSLYTHSAEKSAEMQSGFSDTDGTNILTSRLRFVSQSLSFNLLQGRHKLGSDHLLKWQLNYARTDRNEPDTRDIAYNEAVGVGYRFRNQPGSGERFFSNLVENGGGGGFDLTLRFRGWSLKTGALGRQAERDFSARRFRFRYQGSDASILFQPPEALFSPENLRQSFVLDERTLASDLYKADIRHAATYLMGDITAFGKLRVVGGARFEYFRQELDSGSPFAFASESVPNARHVDGDLLPSLGLIYSVRDDMNVRASYASTVARPLLRELAPFLFFDFNRRRNVQGNPALERTYVYNADLRWELFPGAGQVLAVSVFYKHFSQPIERVIYSDLGDVKFDNALSARTFGAEVEASTGLGLLHPSLRNVSLGANLTLASSNVSLSTEQLAVQTSRERPMQGQSPYVVNVSLGYSRPEWDTELAILYNVYGPRIADVGANFLPDVYERPFHRVDISYAQGLSKNLRLKLTGTNILNQPISLQQRGVTVLRYRPGANVGATLSYTY